MRYKKVLVALRAVDWSLVIGPILRSIMLD